MASPLRDGSRPIPKRFGMALAHPDGLLPIPKRESHPETADEGREGASQIEPRPGEGRARAG
ncbi:hypothetical protein C5C19_13535 [Pseudoclavibacter sp. RFBH5]|nr:hypothetical protein C5C19_13535 [Pseudoclavibacter sp. RFBH5]